MNNNPELNPNQARHVTAYLHLLAEELAVERTFLAADHSGDAARQQLNEVLARLASVLASLGLAPPPKPTPGRRLWGLAETWLSRLEDLKARGLVPYGAVAPGVDRVLDPAIDRLAAALKALSHATAGGDAP